MRNYILKIITLFFSCFMSQWAFSGSIQCNTKKDILSECQVNTGIIFDKQAHLSDFEVTYSLSCDRHNPTPEQSNIFLALDSGQKFYLTLGAKNQVINLGEGMGPIILGDDNPNVLFYRKFNDCSLDFHLIAATLSPKVVNEIKAFVSEIENELSGHLEKLVRYQASMIAAAGAEPSMACMISTYESNPIYAYSLAGIILDMKNAYFATFNREYDADNVICPWSGDLESELKACTPSSLAALCAFKTLYLQEHDWILEKISKAIDLRAGFTESVAIKLLDKLKSELNAALQASETGIYH